MYTWREEPPDKSGWWWVLPYRHEPMMAEVIVDEKDSVLPVVVRFPGARYYESLEKLKCKGYKWAGPIEEPR